MRRRALWPTIWRIAHGFVRDAPLLAAMMLFPMRAGASYAGLPNDTRYFSFHPDEIFLLLPSFGFAAGDWNPHFFNYGTLYIYLVGIPAVLLRIVPTVAAFPEHLRPLYLLGRHLTTVMAVGGVAVLYYGLKREDGEWWFPALSALLLAICPLYVMHSGYATVDVPSTFWLVLAFGLTLSACRREHRLLAAAAGLATGLAAATKYSAGLFLLPALATPYLVRPIRRVPAWWLAVPAGAALGFVIGCPYFWSPEFIQGLLFEMRHMRIGGTTAFVDTGPGWLYHLTHGLPVGLGYPLFLASLAGIPCALAARRRSTRLAALWIIVYFVSIGFARERFIRYLIPLTPFLAVTAAATVRWLADPRRARLSRLRAAAFAALVTGSTWLYTGGQVRALLDRDPRVAAYGAIEAEMGESGRYRHVGLIQTPWYLHPPVSPYNAGPFPLSRELFRQWNDAHGNLVVVTGFDAERLLADPPDVFFVAEQEVIHHLRIGDREATEFVETLHEVYREKSVFQKPPARFAWLAPSRSRQPPDWLYDSPRIIGYREPAR